MAINFLVHHAPGQTVNLTIKRATDEYYWTTGGAWQSGTASVAMSENAGLSTGNTSIYTSDTAPDERCFWVAIDSNGTVVGYSEANGYDPTAATLGDAMTISVGGIPVGAFAANAITDASMALDAEQAIAAAVKAVQVETQGTYTLGQVLSVLLAGVAGETADGGATLKTPNGNTTRIAATIDGSNNRTGMVITPSS